MIPEPGPDLLELMFRAVARVRDRLLRVTAALDAAGVPFAVVGGHAVASLPALVRMKLTSFRLKDRVHLRDMIDVGLIDPGWVAKLPPELGQRLQELLGPVDIGYGVLVQVRCDR